MESKNQTQEFLGNLVYIILIMAAMAFAAMFLLRQTTMKTLGAIMAKFAW
jgi:hypothetical protein